MDTKNKILKTAKTCGTISKVIYCLAIVVCITSIVLAVVLACTNAIKAFTAAETAILFGTIALYAFMAIGLLWNIEQIFVSIVKEQKPFSEKVNHYLKKTGIFLILIATIPAVLGTILVRSIVPATELNFSIELGGVIAGIVLIILGLFFQYGKELEDKAGNRE